MISGNFSENIKFLFFILEHWMIQPTAGTEATWQYLLKGGTEYFVLLPFLPLCEVPYNVHSEAVMQNFKRCMVYTVLLNW